MENLEPLGVDLIPSSVPGSVASLEQIGFFSVSKSKAQAANL